MPRARVHPLGVKVSLYLNWKLLWLLTMAGHYQLGLITKSCQLIFPKGPDENYTTWQYWK